MVVILEARRSTFVEVLQTEVTCGIDSSEERMRSTLVSLKSSSEFLFLVPLHISCCPVENCFVEESGPSTVRLPQFKVILLALTIVRDLIICEI